MKEAVDGRMHKTRHDKKSHFDPVMIKISIENVFELEDEVEDVHNVHESDDDEEKCDCEGIVKGSAIRC